MKFDPATIPSWSRPIRIPAEIQITHPEPPLATAGEPGKWLLPFKLSRPLPAGTGMVLQIRAPRNNHGDFGPLQCNDPQAPGHIAAALADGTPLSLNRDDDAPNSWKIAGLAAGLAQGTELHVFLGNPAAAAPGPAACKYRMLNKMFILAAAGGGKGGDFPDWGGGKTWTTANDKAMLAACTIHILGGAPARLRLYAPASVRPGEPFKVLLRPEDRLGNLANARPPAIELRSGSAKLTARFETLPGSTCLHATVALSTPGVHRLTAHAADGGAQLAVGNPQVCALDAEPVLWGMIHGHTEMSDGVGTLDQYFRQLRDDVLLDFASTSDHDHRWETSDEYWQATMAAVRRWHATGSFVALLGYEWAKWRRRGDGDLNVYYADDDGPFIRSDDGDAPTPPELFAGLRASGRRAIVIPHHPAHGGNFCDWKDHSPEHERLVELFQTRGSYECAAEDGNPLPEKRDKPAPYKDGFVRNALALGWRVGFTGGGDDHQGQWGTEYEQLGGDGCYKQGLMSLIAPEKSREAVFAAMYDRRVTATSGPRILLSYTLAGRPMGSELKLAELPALAADRALQVAFHGTAPAAKIEIIRNNRVVHAVPGAGRLDVEFTWNDAEALAAIALPPAKFCPRSFTFYYVRVIQEDGEMAWASPVWID